MAAQCCRSTSQAGVAMPRNSIEIFSGMGGLALGMSRAGFKHLALVEKAQNAVDTVVLNKTRKIKHIADWPLIQKDVREIDWKAYRGLASALAGGPPCQPFGIGGKKKGHEDERDMWPETVRAVRVIDPTAFTFENVRNLAGPRFHDYLEWVKASLGRPNYPRREEETHAEHLARLRAMKTPPMFLVDHLLVNAADYGAAQVRWRVLVRGILAAAGIPLAPLIPTHSLDRLLWDQWQTGDYWRRHRLPQPPDNAIPEPQRVRVEKLRGQIVPPAGLPWVTVRDAIAGLGEPDGKNNHVMQFGARVYKGHTGSALDMPSKALKAGDHGVPGGENMVVLDNGSVRYFTMREAARLVDLPDDYLFPASWTETMRGLGNAVPATLGEAIGRWLVKMTSQVEKAARPKRRRGAG